VDSVREFYVALVQASGGSQTGVVGQTVDFMLDAMEGLKQRALYEPGICSPQSEKSIVQNLMRILGVNTLELEDPAPNSVAADMSRLIINHDPSELSLAAIVLETPPEV
jgi:hypothetical protein